MDIVFNCTNCGQALAVPSRMAGHEVSCSSCGAVLTAPAVAPSNSRRQTILAIGTLAAILLIGSVVAFLVLRPGRNQSKATADTAEASSAAPTREETPMEVVTKAANRLAATNHSWLLTFPLDRKDENPLLKSFGNVEGETDGLITYGKISLGISDLQFAYTPTKVAILQKGKWIVVADDGDEKLGQIRVHKSAGALAQYLASGIRRVKSKESEIVCDLNKEVSTELLAGPVLRNGRRQNPTDVKGEATFWIDQGQLQKLNIVVTGTLTDPAKNKTARSTNSMTVEVKNVGTTALSLPADVQAMLRATR